MQRLDKYLQDQYDSRSKAADAIKNGAITVNGKVITKPGFMIDPEQDVIVRAQDEDLYASRGAYKLVQALDTFQIDVKGRTALDIGASTGGFSDVLLRRGVHKVYALDVGHMQLLPRLEADERLVKMEGRNARAIQADWFDEPIDLVVMDVSFISARTILDAVLPVLNADEMVILVKPQFEAGPAHLNKNGVLKNEKVRRQILDEMKAYGAGRFHTVQLIDTTLKGRSGNQEALLHLKGRIKDD